MPTTSSRPRSDFASRWRASRRRSHVVARLRRRRLLHSRPSTRLLALIRRDTPGQEYLFPDLAAVPTATAGTPGLGPARSARSPRTARYTARPESQFPKPEGSPQWGSNDLIIGGFSGLCSLLERPRPLYAGLLTLPLTGRSASQGA